MVSFFIRNSFVSGFEVWSLPNPLYTKEFSFSLTLANQHACSLGHVFRQCLHGGILEQVNDGERLIHLFRKQPAGRTLPIYYFFNFN